MKKLLLVLPFFLSFYFNSNSQSYNSTWLSSTYTGSKAFDVKVDGRFAYVVGWDEDFYGNTYGTFSIIDVQFPTAPNPISQIFINDTYGIDVSGDFAFLAESMFGLSIYQISNPALPQFVSRILLPSSAKDVKVVGNLAYVADEYAGLRIIDVSNIQNPIEIGYYDTPGRSYDVEIKGDLAYVADLSGGLVCISISDPTKPILINSFPASDQIIDIDIKGDLAYLTDGYAGIKVVNISDPLNISLVDELYLPYWCLGIKVSDNYAYVAAWEFGGLRIIDISNSENLQEVGFYNTWGKSRDIDVIGSLAYLADWDGGGLTIINNDIINPLPVELISFTGECNGDEIVLHWTTASELNNAGFEIEMKSVNNEWRTIGFVKGSGTTTETRNYNFTDQVENNSPAKYQYRLKQIDFNGAFDYSNEIEVNVNIPSEYKLYQNYPNPFNPSTTIRFQMPERSEVSLKIYDLLGNEVKTLFNEIKDAGFYDYDFNAGSLASGIYFYSLHTDKFSKTYKMILLK